MKIGSIKEITANERIIEVSGWKIFATLLSAGIITGVVSVLTFIYIDLPKNEANLDNDWKSQKFEMLEFALRAESDTIRNNSILLLIESNIIKDPDNRIKKLVESNSLPDWSNMPDEIEDE